MIGLHVEVPQKPELPLMGSSQIAEVKSSLQPLVESLDEAAGRRSSIGKRIREVTEKPAAPRPSKVLGSDLEGGTSRVWGPKSTMTRTRPRTWDCRRYAEKRPEVVPGGSGLIGIDGSPMECLGYSSCLMNCFCFDESPPTVGIW